MGRKRNQGKARRAAKAKQEAEGKKNGQTATSEEERADNNGQTMPANTNDLGQALAVEIQRMQNDDTKCKHGFDPFSSGEISSQFVPAFVGSFEAGRVSGSGTSPTLQVCLIAAQKITMNEFADVWNDSTEIELAMSFFLYLGTQDILNGEYDHAKAKTVAAMARFLEQHIAVELEQTQPLFRFNKTIETYYADQHTLVTFFRKRIPCSCLDKKYEEVKHISKLGLCYNPQCSHFQFGDGRVEYSKTMYCDRCLRVTYCSRSCQKAHWKEHKPDCEKYTALISEFEDNKKQS